MKIYAFDFKNLTITAYPTVADAQAAGNGRTLAANADDLMKALVSGDQMVNLYNNYVPDFPIKKFETKLKGAERLILLAQSKATEGKTAPKEAEPVASKTNPESVKKSPTKKAEGEGKRGRTSEFVGKRIFPVEGLEGNPRREGTGGYNSMSIIISAGKRGITFENFIEKGGRAVDLRWDIAHGSVIVE